MSDNGKQFDNLKFRDFCAELGIKNYYSSPAHPQSNGQAKVTIRTLKAALKTKLEDLKGKWVEYLPEVLWAYRTTHKSATQETPLALAFGTEAVAPVSYAWSHIYLFISICLLCYCIVIICFGIY